MIPNDFSYMLCLWRMQFLCTAYRCVSFINLIRIFSGFFLSLYNDTEGNKSGKSLLIEDGTLPWIVKNANNEASPIRRHIELALCHLAQHGELDPSLHFRILIIYMTLWSLFLFSEANAKDMISEGALWELVRISRDCSREDIRSLAHRTLISSTIFQSELRRLRIVLWDGRFQLYVWSVFDFETADEGLRREFEEIWTGAAGSSWFVCSHSPKELKIQRFAVLIHAILTEGLISRTDATELWKFIWC